MSESSWLRTTRAVLSRTPAYSMIKVEEVDGKRRFINTITGQEFSGSNALKDAMAYADALRIADFREIDSSGEVIAGKITGAAANADRVLRLNNYLADPTNRAALASMGLEDLSGGSVSGRMILFDTENTASAVAGIRRTISERAPGEVVLTDGGMQLFSLSQAVTSAGEVMSLSHAQQEALKQLAKINIFKHDTVGDFFKNVGTAITATSEDDKKEALTEIGKIVGKMTKRYQSAFSPRDVSTGAAIVRQLVDEGLVSADHNYRYDRVEAILKTAAGGYDSLSPEEKVLLSPALASAESVDIGLTRGLPTSDISESIFVPKKAESAAEAAFNLIEEQLQIRVTDHISGSPRTYVPDDYQSLSSELRSAINEALSEQQRIISAGGTRKTLIEILKENSSSYTPELQKIIENKLGDAIVSSVDGHYILVGRAQQRIKQIKEQALEDLKRSGRIDGEKLNQIRQLENEIEAHAAAIDSSMRNPSRVLVPGLGVLKGEASVLSVERILGAQKGDFEAIEEIYDTLQKKVSAGVDLSADEQKMLEYTDLMINLRTSFGKKISIADVSALKKEIIGEDIAIAQNIAKGKGSGVFVEDMLLLNDPEFMISPQRQQRIQAMIDAEARSAQEFMETGKIPTVVLDQIKEQASVDLASMDPAAKALALTNRKQAIEISQALRSGVDPRRIPALVNMISKYHISQAFMSDGAKVAVRIPDAMRLKIATKSSALLESLVGGEFESLSSVPILDSSGRSFQLPMVNFVTRDKQMIVSDSITSTYKAAEGTFDLDDSGLPMLGTYRDHKGRVRIAAVTMRDPKGFQESILMKPQLTHAETLTTMLSDDSGLIRRQALAATDAEVFSLASKVRDSAQIGQTDAIDAVNIAIDLIRGEKTIDTRVLQGRLLNLKKSLGEDTDVALETAVRIIREGMFGQRLAEDISEMAPISQKLLYTLAERGSAAIRGLDVLDPVTGLPVGAAKALTPEQGAPYSYKYFYELGSQADQVGIGTIEPVRMALAQALGVDPGSLPASELSTLFESSSAGDALRASRGLTLDQVRAAGEKTLLEYVAKTTEGKLDDVQNSIGLTINRMASANFLAPQIEEFESTLKTLATSRLGAPITTSLFGDDVAARYTVGMKAPSDIVDLINQMSGATRVPSLESITDPVEKLRAAKAYEAIAKYAKGSTAETLHDFSITPSAIAQASLEQQGRLLGRQRAMGLALGVAPEDLPGFDPLVIEPGGRLDVKNDILNLRNSMVQEYQGVVTELRAAGMSDSELSAVESEINALKAADIDTIRRILSMSQKQVGRYGSISKAREIAMTGKARLESLTPKPTSSTLAEIRAISDPRYSDSARGFLKTQKIRTLFEEAKKLQDEVVTKGKPERLIKTLASQIKSELGEELSKGLRVIEENHRGSGANVLDIVETLEAEMQNLYGARAGKFLEYIGHEGEEDLMMQLQNLSAQRRALRLTSFDPRGGQEVQKHFDVFRRIALADPDAVDELGGRISTNIMDITREEARQILKINEERIKARRKKTSFTWNFFRPTCFGLP